MISLSVLQSTAVVLLALLLLASAGAAAKDVLGKKSDRLSADSVALRVAREIDLFYYNMCSPGVYCMARIRLPDAFCGIAFTGNMLTVCVDGVNALSSITAPIAGADYTVQNPGGGNELILRWSY